MVHLCLAVTGLLSPLASSCMVTLSYQISFHVLANWHRKVNCHLLVCPTDPAVPRENCPGHPRQGVPNQVGPLSIKVTLSILSLSSLSTQSLFLSNTLHPCSASSRSWRKKALAWQLHTGGLCFSLGEREQAVQCVLSHWSLVQTYFKACGSQQGSYVLLLIFTSIWSTLSKSTQWDLYRVINIPQLSGLPLPCSKSSYHSLAISDTPGYCVFSSDYNSLLRFVWKKEKFRVFLGHWLTFSSSLSFFPCSHREVNFQTGGWRREPHQNRALLLWNLMEIWPQIFTLNLLDTHTFPILCICCYHRFSSCQLHAVPAPHMAKPGVFAEGCRMYPVPGCPGFCSNVPVVFSEMRRKLRVLIIPGAKLKV